MSKAVIHSRVRESCSSKSVLYEGPTLLICPLSESIHM